MDNLQQLCDIVRGGQIQGNQYWLSLAALSMPNSDEWLAKYFQEPEAASDPENAQNSSPAQDLPPGPYLVLQDYELPPDKLSDDATSFILTGTGQNQIFSGMKVSACFTLPGQEPAVLFQASAESSGGTALPGWNLPCSFPLFISTVLANLEFASTPNVPTFQLASYDVSNEVKAGQLFFTGILTPTSVLGGLTGFFTNPQPILVGTVDMQNGIPSMTLQTTAAEKIPLGFSTDPDLIFQVCSRPLANENGLPDDAHVFLRFQADLPLHPPSPDPSIRIVANVYDPQTSIDLSIDFDHFNPVTAGLDAIASLAKGVTFSDKIDSLKQFSGFKLLEEITLKDVFARIDPSGPKIVSFGARIKNTEPWPLINVSSPGTPIALNQFEMVINVLLTDRTANVMITGIIDVENNDFFGLSLFAPDYAITGGMIEGTTVKLNKVVEYFTGSDNASTIPELELAGFNFSAEIGKNYTLNLDVREGWTLVNLDKASLILEEVKLALQYDSAKGISGSLIGILTLAEADLELTADYRGGAAGWLFELTAGHDKPLDLVKLVDSLLPDGTKIPEDMVGLTLSQLTSSWDTGSKEFIFGGTMDFALKIGEKSLPEISFTLDIDSTFTNNTRNTAGKLTGQLKQGDWAFDVTYEFKPDIQILSAAWSDKGGVPVFEDLAEVLGFAPPALPAGWTLNLNGASFTYDFTDKILVLSAKAQFGDSTTDTLAATLVIDAQGTSTLYGFLMDFKINDLNLSNLPLVGKELASIETLSINDLQILIASASDAQAAGSTQVFTPDIIQKTLNPLIGADYPQLPPGGVNSGVNFSGSLSWGSNTTALSSPISDSGATAIKKPGQPTVQSDNTKWIDLQKSFGPVSFRRVGVRYADSVLAFLLDASLSAGGLTISLDGLSIGSPLTKFDPRFSLAGLGIEFAEGPLEIGGAFVARSGKALGGNDFQYDGGVVIKAENFALQGFGSYASRSGSPSFFAFVQLEAELGGPPFFFVTGLAGGFGYNRSLAIPDQNEVMNFPLVKGLSDSNALGGPKPDPLAVLDILEGTSGGKAWITTQLGQDWLAAGVQFTSFDIIKSNALLIVEFGKTFEVAIVGLSVIKLPQEENAKTYAYAELALRVVLDPAAGLFSASAVLTSNSYVIDPACHLTGGFAFYVWFSGDHAGDFILTIGGYHPQFVRPDWYPVEPRLGFDWALSSEVTIKGEAYFALTPSCVMAGGGLEVSYHSGNLQAWCKAQADFIVKWKPFFFDAKIDISIGVSYLLDILGLKKTFQVELAVSLELWGPPTAGRLYINWYIISFTVDFGATDIDSQSDTELDWDGFKTLLPAQPSSNTSAVQAMSESETKSLSEPLVCQIMNTRGLIATIDNGDGSSTWLVQAEGFEFSTATTIPSTQVSFDSSSNPYVKQSTQQVDIRPMGVTNATSTHSVTLSRLDTGLGTKVPSWDPEENIGNVPEALWGKPLSNDETPSPQANVLQNHLTGFKRIRTSKKNLNGTPPLSIDKTFTYTILDSDNPNFLPLMPPKKSTGLSSNNPVRDDGVLQTITDTLTKTDAMRSQVLDSLKALGFDTLTNGDLTQLAGLPAAEFEASPLLTGKPTVSGKQTRQQSEKRQ